MEVKTMQMSQPENALTLDTLPEILTAENISQYLCIGYVKALRLIKYGGIPHLRIGNTFRISKRAFEEWLMKPESRVITFQ